MNKTQYLVYAYKNRKYPFDEKLMWASSLEEAQKLREEWLSSQEEEKEAEIFVVDEKSGLLVNHLHSL